MSSSIETEILQWLNINFLEKHLRNYYENNEIKVHSFVVESATAAGENFASSIYRVKFQLSMSYTDVVL